MKVGNIVTDIKHPETGETLLTEDKIKEFLQHKVIKRSAYILHDRDIYQEDDVINETKRLKAKYELLSEEEKKETSEENYISKNRKSEIGKTKPAHWHIVVEFSRNQSVEEVARWLDLPPNMINIPKGPKGRNNFLDCVEYLTHSSDKEQQKGKTLYSDEDVIANFEWRDSINEYKSKLAKYGAKGEKDYYRRKILYEGMTIRQMVEENPEAYQNDFEKINKLRRDFIQKWMEMPSLKINFYIEGAGGIGKGSCSKLLAKALCPDLTLEESTFVVGGTNVTFEGYDGQQIMIWNDRRAIQFLTDFGRENTFEIFDPIPTGRRENIKNSSVRLANTFNIINGVQPYSEFLDGLAGQYTGRDGEIHKVEDKGQSYRRFPIIICLREDDFDLLINKGFANNTREYEQYIAYKNIVGNFGKIMQMLEGAALEKIGNQMCEPIVTQTKALIEKGSTKIANIEDIPKDFLNYGRSITELEADPFS